MNQQDVQSADRPNALLSLGRRLVSHLVLGALIFAGLCLVYGFEVEPHWLRVRTIRINAISPLALAHISDIHYKGDRRYLEKVVRAVNRQNVDFVCFTGDLVESVEYLDDALAAIQQIRHPVYGIPGNHESWARIDRGRLDAAFRKTGGRFLVNEPIQVGNRFAVVGLDDLWRGDPDPKRAFEGTEGAQRVVLIHEPALVDQLGDRSFALALAGHSHGGQVRLPFWGALVLPQLTGKYQRGLYQTSGGPLYVNPGIGTYGTPVRFLCRPEVTVFRGR